MRPFPTDRGGGRLTKTNDYHSHDTTYTYTDGGAISRVTAPGSQTWDFDYDVIGRPTHYSWPNGMHTYYEYDGKQRMTKIYATAGTSTVDSFIYAMDLAGNITEATQFDGSLWEYGYDDRYRLTSATRKNAATPTIEADYTYQYDDADNLISKTEPFFDDFNDGNITGWTGPYNASSGYVERSSVDASRDDMYRTSTDADADIRFSYVCQNAGESSSCVHVYTRYVDSDNNIFVMIYPSYIKLVEEEDDGGYEYLDTETVTSTDDVWYDIRVVQDDDVIQVWRGPKGGQMELILEEDTDVDILTTAQFFISMAPDSDYGIDNIQLISDYMGSTTTTYAYESQGTDVLESITVNSVTTEYERDYWGKTISKYVSGGASADYDYAYGGKLVQADSSFPNEGTVDYEYGGDGKRRRRTVTGGGDTWFYWDSGYNVLGELDISGLTFPDDDYKDGTLTTTYIPGLAQVAGSNPATGTYSYYSKDHLESTRGLYDASKNQVGSFEYTPYGNSFAALGTVDTTRRYTGHAWDSASQLYYAPYRYYSPNMARWMKRDPAGMVDGPNVYAYVGGNPVRFVDRLGLDYDQWYKLGAGKFFVGSYCVRLLGKKVLEGILTIYDKGDSSDPDNWSTDSWKEVETHGIHASVPADFVFIPGMGIWKVRNGQTCRLACWRWSSGKVTKSWVCVPERVLGIVPPSRRPIPDDGLPPLPPQPKPKPRRRTRTR